jgi:hypothetical protein
LNLLRTSRLHPQLTAAAHYHGLVDYNKTAFAQPGCKFIAHEKPGKRRTWAPHGQHGYSLGLSMRHYRCQNVYISKPASERIVGTLELFPHNYQKPLLSSTDRLLIDAKDMTDALQKTHPEVPFASVGDDTISALLDLAAIFKLKLQQAPSPRDQSFASQCHSTPNHHSIINSNLELTHAQQAANDITDDNSQSRHPQCAITS